jgi:fluoride ion exporter CrcB/FEX
MTWPGGMGTQLRLDGRARDALTTADGELEVLARAELSCGVTSERIVEEIATTPPLAGIGGLIGARAGGNLRRAITEAVPEETDAGRPIALLLDDLAGASLIAGVVMILFADANPDLAERIRTASSRQVEGICSGFRPGSTALNADGTVNGTRQAMAVVPPLVDPADPNGWHVPVPHPAMATQRARRIDVWREDDELVIDAMFRDSAWDPAGIESAIHEYQLLARAGPDGLLRSVDAIPRVLPYTECSGAAANASWLTGTEVGALRRVVLERLKGPDCCTHLNDALRSLAEVPILAAALD